MPVRQNGKQLPPRDTHINYGSASVKESVIERWFNPIDGRFRGWNIGIACGRSGGAFALDIDKRGDEVDGYESLHEFEAEWGTLPAAPVARTPGGGEHRLYRWQEFGACSTDKVAKGIDTRGGTATACKGHIVVFPSIVDGKMYDWEQGGDISPIPSSILAAMGVPIDPALAGTPQIGRGNENVGQEDLERQVTMEQVCSMLDYIDPDDLSYDRWLRIGQAIHSQHSGDDGLEAWDEWSRRGKRYKKGECHIRWRGFKEGGNVRMGTLFYHAKNGGWNPSDDDTKPTEWNDLIEGINENHAMVMVGGKIRVLKERPAPDPALGYYELMHREDFRSLYANDIHAFMKPDGKFVYRTSADIWLAHENRRTYPNGLGMFPAGAPVGWYNTWTGWAYEPDIGSTCESFLEHIRLVVCNNDMELYAWVLDWMADAIQDPEDPKGCAIVLKGKEGTGKGTFADTFGRLFGAHYRHLIDDHHLTGNFNAHMQDALLVFADEVVWGGNKKTAGKLKGLVTERYIMAERKGVDAVTMRNMVRLIMASNEDWVIPAGPQSRRWLVLEMNDAHRQDRAYFTRIRKEMAEGGMGALMHLLRERKIESDLTRAPHTEALSRQRELHQSGNSPVQWWYDVLSTKDVGIPDEESSYDNQPDWPKTVNRDVLYQSYQAWCATMQIKPEFKTKWLRAMENFGARARRAGDKTRVWVLDLPTWGKSIIAFQRATGINVDLEGEINDEEG